MKRSKSLTLPLSIRRNTSSPPTLPWASSFTWSASASSYRPRKLSSSSWTRFCHQLQHWWARSTKSIRMRMGFFTSRQFPRLRAIKVEALTQCTATPARTPSACHPRSHQSCSTARSNWFTPWNDGWFVDWRLGYFESGFCLRCVSYVYACSQGGNGGTKGKTFPNCPVVPNLGSCSEAYWKVAEKTRITTA